MLYRGGMQLGEVAALARERLGMEIQAVELLRVRADGSRAPEVWSLLTEHGHFWLVEGAGAVELLRAPVAGGARSVAAAVGRFLQLHPQQRPARGRPPPVTPAPSEYDCARCGVRVTPRRRSGMVDRQLCRRCHHAAREREQYRDDPEYRARFLAIRRYRYRAAREGSGP